MATPILRRIRRELAARSLSIDHFLDYLGIPQFALDMWDPDKDREPLRKAADFLGLRLSDLILESGNMRAYAEVYFDEQWPRYRDKLNTSKEAAWMSIESTVQYRGGWSDVRDDIELTLQGLLPLQPTSPQSSNVACLLGECHDGCVTRCRRTGRLPGA